MTNPRGRLQELITAIPTGGPSGRALAELVEVRTVCRELVDAGATGWRLLLATDAVAVGLRSAGRRAKALDAAREAADMYCELADGKREAFLTYITTSLTDQCKKPRQACRRAEALERSGTGRDLPAALMFDDSQLETAAVQRLPASRETPS